MPNRTRREEEGTAPSPTTDAGACATPIEPLVQFRKGAPASTVLSPLATTSSPGASPTYKGRAEERTSVAKSRSSDDEFFGIVHGGEGTRRRCGGGKKFIAESKCDRSGDEAMIEVQHRRQCADAATNVDGRFVTDLR